MTATGNTQRARLERAFETLRKKDITPLLILSGSTGVLAENLEDYTELARLVGTPRSWVGAHVGAREHRGAWFDEDGDCYRFRYDDSPVLEIWFSFPLGRGDIALALRDALHAEGFQTSWLQYDEDGQALGPGTAADSVRLILKEN